MTIVICIIFSILVLCSCLIRVTDWKSNVNTNAILVFIVTSFLFMFLLIAIAINRLDCKNEMVEIQSLRETVEIAREQQIIERAALTTKIADANKWLASAKYWNDTTFDIFWLDEVEDIKPIK